MAPPALSSLQMSHELNLFSHLLRFSPRPLDNLIQIDVDCSSVELEVNFERGKTFSLLTLHCLPANTFSINANFEEKSKTNFRENLPAVCL
jgi:hypothetical protein